MKTTAYGNRCYLLDAIVDRGGGSVDSKTPDASESLLEGTRDDGFSDCDANCTTQRTAGCLSP